METILSLVIGYLIGSVSPAAILGKRRDVDLTKEGTKNLGATNTMLILGRKAGILVMVLDMGKAWLSSRIARALFPHLLAAGILASLGAILGHCFPLFLNFRGGKGLASFGGMVLAYKPWFFLAIVAPGLVLMAVFNTGVAMPMLGSVMFPILVYITGGSTADTLAALAAGCLLAWMHRDNLRRALRGEDYIPVNSFLETILFRKRG